MLHGFQGLEGYSQDPGFHKEIVWDSGFDFSWKAGFAKIGHRIQDSNLKRNWDMGSRPSSRHSMVLATHGTLTIQKWQSSKLHVKMED